MNSSTRVTLSPSFFARLRKLHILKVSLSPLLSLSSYTHIEMAPPPLASTLTQPLARSNGESDQKQKEKQVNSNSEKMLIAI